MLQHSATIARQNKAGFTAWGGMACYRCEHGTPSCSMLQHSATIARQNKAGFTAWGGDGMLPLRTWHCRQVAACCSTAPPCCAHWRGLAVARQNKAIAAWVNSINELHRSKPPTQVNYGKLMPDIEQLMQVGLSVLFIWPLE